MTAATRLEIYGLAIGFFWFSQYVYVPVFPAYIREMGIAYDMLGVIIGSYGFTQMLLRIPLGIWSDTINKRRIFIIAGVVASVISSLGMWLFPTEQGLLFFRGLSGAAAATWVIHTVTFASMFPANEASKAMGIVNAINNAGQLTAMLLGGWLAFYLGQEFTFVAAAAGGLIGIILSFAATDPAGPKRPALTVSELLTMMKRRNLAIASLLAFGLQVLTYSTVFGFTPVAARQIGANNWELGLLQVLYVLPGIVASALSGTYFAKRLGERFSIVAGFIAMAAAFAAIPLFTNMVSFYLSQLLGGFARGLLFPLLMSISLRDIPGYQRASAMGVFQAIYGVGMFLGPLLFGMVSAQAGLAWGFWLIGLLGLVGAVFALLQLKKCENNN